jgi:hypothetical protein
VASLFGGRGFSPLPVAVLLGSYMFGVMLLDGGWCVGSVWGWKRGRRVQLTSIET